MADDTAVLLDELARRAASIGREVDRLEDLLAELGPVPGLEGLAVRLREVVDELAGVAASAELGAVPAEVSWSEGLVSEWRLDGEATRHWQATLEEARARAQHLGLAVEHEGAPSARTRWWTR